MVLGSDASEGARAYYRGGKVIQAGVGATATVTRHPVRDSGLGGRKWHVTEEFLVNTADESEKLARIPTHMAFWFGWFQFHPDTELYTGPDHRNWVSLFPVFPSLSIAAPRLSELRHYLGAE